MTFRTSERSAVNPFIKITLFLVNFVLILLGLGLWTTMTWILVQKEKKIEMVADFLFDLSCLFCLAGSLMNTFSFCGCWGSLRENIILLKIYNLSVSLLILLQVVLIVFVFIFYYVPESRTTLNLYPEGVLEDAVERYWVDDDMKNLIDDMQKTFECCGASADDSGYKDWNKNIYFNCSGESQWKCSVPYSCCKLKVNEPINYLCGGGTLEDNANTVPINTKGCLKGLEDWINENNLVIGGSIIGVLIPQMALVWLARTLIFQIKIQLEKQIINRRQEQ